MQQQQPLFGDVLGRLVALNHHDVEEILHEQAATRRRFGQVALAWGLCGPEHVWQAWSIQLAGRTPRVDLGSIGVDARTTAHLPGPLAAGLGVVPVRLLPGGLVVAASEATLARAADVLSRRLGRAPTFVLADAGEIDAAIRTYYPPIVTAAAAPPADCAGRPCASRCAGAACRRRGSRDGAVGADAAMRHAC